MWIAWVLHSFYPLSTALLLGTYGISRSARIAGGIMAAAYLGFIVIPSVVGWMAELLGLQVALLLAVGATGLGMLWLVRDVQ